MPVKKCVFCETVVSFEFFIVAVIIIAVYFLFLA